MEIRFCKSIRCPKTKVLCASKRSVPASTGASADTELKEHEVRAVWVPDHQPSSFFCSVQKMGDTPIYGHLNGHFSGKNDGRQTVCGVAHWPSREMPRFRPFNPQDGQVSLGSGFIVKSPEVIQHGFVQKQSKTWIPQEKPQFIAIET